MLIRSLKYSVSLTCRHIKKKISLARNHSFSGSPLSINRIYQIVELLLRKTKICGKICFCIMISRRFCTVNRIDGKRLLCFSLGNCCQTLFFDCTQRLRLLICIKAFRLFIHILISGVSALKIFFVSINGRCACRKRGRSTRRHSGIYQFTSLVIRPCSLALAGCRL